MAVPVALNSATVAPEQSVCVAFPVGADGLVFIVTTTGVRETLSHPSIVCVA
jgi:hypothetical protein